MANDMPTSQAPQRKGSVMFLFVLPWALSVYSASFTFPRTHDSLFGAYSWIFSWQSLQGICSRHLTSHFGQVLNVFVVGTDGGEAKMVTNDTHRGIRMCEWAKNNRHLLYMQDADGDGMQLRWRVSRSLTSACLLKNMTNHFLPWLKRRYPATHSKRPIAGGNAGVWMCIPRDVGVTLLPVLAENWHIYSVDLETEIVRDLTPFQGIRSDALFTSKSDPDNILVGLNLTSRSVFDMYRCVFMCVCVCVWVRAPSRARSIFFIRSFHFNCTSRKSLSFVHENVASSVCSGAKSIL